MSPPQVLLYYRYMYILSMLAARVSSIGQLDFGAAELLKYGGSEQKLCPGLLR